MAFFSDSLRSAIGAVSRLNPFARYDTGTALSGAFSNQLALAAYMSSGMLRKVIAIPAEDRVREWRDWQAEKEQIAAIEEEERRLGLQAKIKQAEILRGIGGGALVLITATSDHAQPLKPDTIAKGGLIAINVVSRWQIQGKDWVRDLADPDFGTPRMFEISGDGQNKPIHPSRVICFRGDPLPAGAAVADEEAFWGDSKLLRVFGEVQRADQTQEWFAALVKKAKLLRIGIPDMDQMDQEKLGKRVEVIAMGESTLNATLFRSASGPDGAGETITDYQITWAGIPAMMDAFDQRVAAVSDIPFTRLMGRSPAGMNATGEHDMDNWDRSVMAGQRLETRPCLEQLDPALIRSAGVDPADVTWRFAPLSTPSEQQQAETFDKRMDAVTKLQNTGAIPDVAFAKAVQNLLSETEDLPGLDQALSEIPEAERFGLNPEPDDTDPSALTESTNGGKEADPKSAGGGRRAPAPARRAANDKLEVGEGVDLPFLDSKRRNKRQRLAGHAAASHFDPTQPRDRNGRWIPTGRRAFIDAARAGASDEHRLDIGQVSAKTAVKLRALGVQGDGKSISLDASNVRHIHKRHGSEQRSSHSSVTGGDIASAAGVLNAARSMRLVSPAPTGARRFATVTRSKGQRVYAVFEVRKRTIALHTMWIRE